jgi:hypothetical protein
MIWKYIGSTYNDSFVINGVDIFRFKWIDTGKIAKVKDPIYGVLKSFTIWTIYVENGEITFAAGEFSNNVWGIYTGK